MHQDALKVYIITYLINSTPSFISLSLIFFALSVNFVPTALQLIVTLRLSLQAPNAVYP